MRIHYGILIQGQGHLNRGTEMVRQLRARGHQVSVLLTGDPPPAYARLHLGEYDFVGLPNLAVQEGRLLWGRTATGYLRSVPLRLRRARALAQKLRQERVDLVLTDFEPVSIWAAHLARIPTAGISGQYRITRTDAPGPAGRAFERAAAQALIHTFTPALGHYFPVSFAPARAIRPATTVVDPIVGLDVREAAVQRSGFRLAYLYSYSEDRVLQTLRGHGRYRVYGLNRQARYGDIELCATDRAEFVRDLAACEGVILNGSFQAVCEAAVLGKPILSIPFGDNYEEAFNAALIEQCGLGVAAAALSSAAVGKLAALTPGRPSCLGDGAAQVLAKLGL